MKCESEGNYLEASRAHKQLGVLRAQEEKRQQKVIQARHISERQDVQAAHQMQYQEFSRAWDRYIEEYDQMAQMYIQQMTERHALVLLEYQKRLREELASKPPKWSKNLMDQRRKQHINARNKNYLMAQKLKKISDMEEMKEREEMEQNQTVVFIRKETKFRQQQQSELQALLKRIECRRKEHIVQREMDTKRLLQRNKNVQSVLENKQAQEENKLFAEIKKNLYSSSILYVASGGGGTIRNKSASSGGMGQSHSQSHIQSTSQSHSPSGVGAGSGAAGARSVRSHSHRASNASAKGQGSMDSFATGSASSPGGFNLPNIRNDQEMMAQQSQEDGQGQGSSDPDQLGGFASLVYHSGDLEDESLETYA